MNAKNRQHQRTVGILQGLLPDVFGKRVDPQARQWLSASRMSTQAEEISSEQKRRIVIFDPGQPL